MKRPASQWYWADWLRDPAVRASRLEARGLWMDMMALMHEGEPYGHLTVGGAAVDPPTLARMVGESPAKVRRLLAELEGHRVFSRTEPGTIYSRRMVRDEHIRTIRKESGSLGGNPTLLDKQKDKQNQRPEVKEKPTPSSSSSFASKNLLPPRDLPVEFHPDYEKLISRVADPDAWAAEMRVAGQGMHGPVRTPLQIGQAIRDYIANGASEKPNLRHFRAYLAGTVSLPPRLANGKRGTQQDRNTAVLDAYLEDKSDG